MCAGLGRRAPIDHRRPSTKLRGAAIRQTGGAGETCPANELDPTGLGDRVHTTAVTAQAAPQFRELGGWRSATDRGTKRTSKFGGAQEGPAPGGHSQRIPGPQETALAASWPNRRRSGEPPRAPDRGPLSAPRRTDRPSLCTTSADQAWSPSAAANAVRRRAAPIRARCPRAAAPRRYFMFLCIGFRTDGTQFPSVGRRRN